MYIQRDFVNIIVDGIEFDEKELLMDNLKATRIPSFELPPDTFRLVSSLRRAHDIWDRLKELYYGDVDLTHSIQTTLLFEFVSFEKKPDESIDQSVTRFNHLLSRMLMHDLSRKNDCIKSYLSEWSKI